MGKLDYFKMVGSIGLGVSLIMTLIQADKYLALTGNGGGYWCLLALAFMFVSSWLFAYVKFKPKVDSLNDLNMSLKYELESLKDYIKENQDMYEKQLTDTVDYYENENAKLLSEIEKLRPNNAAEAAVEPKKAKVTKSK